MFPCVGKSFRQEFLDSVNAYRAQHHAPPLTLNGEMNAAAQKWADRLLGKSSLEQSGTKDGESTYSMHSSALFIPTGETSHISELRYCLQPHRAVWVGLNFCSTFQGEKL